MLVEKIYPTQSGISYMTLSPNIIPRASLSPNRMPIVNIFPWTCEELKIAKKYILNATMKSNFSFK